MVELGPSYYDSEMHVLTICHPSTHPVIVPIGPVIPRRDSKECYNQYCRLMLIFFKPWWKVSDLWAGFENWPAAFAQYIYDNSNEDIQKTMDHMQILHECRDCQADHFRHHRSWHRNQNVSQEVQESWISEADGFADEQDILTHVEAVEACHSWTQDKFSKNVLPCLLHAHEGGIFFEEGENDIGDVHESEDASCIPTENQDLEDKWDESYADR